MGHTKYRKNVSGGSSHSLARAVANKQKDHLHMRQLEKHSLLQKAANFRHQREWEEADLQHEIEMLEASHELKAATVKRQILQEELENGGFISGDGNDEDASRLLKQGTPKSKISYDTLNLTPVRMSDPVVLKPKEQHRTVPKLSILKTLVQGTKTTTVKVNQSSEFQNSSKRTSNAESATVVVNLMKEAMSKPTLKLFKFDEKPMAYSRFISVFESTLEETENDDGQKLLYLIQHCTDKAKSLIDFCLLLRPTQGLAKAKQIIYENYGKKNMIARSYINALSDGPLIKPNDSTALINLEQKLEECSTTLEHLHYFSDLNCFENLVKIIRRLPLALQTRLLHSVGKIDEEGREPRFSDVRKFVAKEAVVVKSSYAPINKGKNRLTFQSILLILLESRNLNLGQQYPTHLNTGHAPLMIISGTVRISNANLFWSVCNS